MKIRTLQLTDTQARRLRRSLDDHLSHLRNNEAFDSGQGQGTRAQLKEIEACENLKLMIRKAPKRDSKEPSPVEFLRTALSGVLGKYVDLANSGDAGNWDPEEVAEVIAARYALAAIKP